MVQIDEQDTKILTGENGPNGIGMASAKMYEIRGDQLIVYLEPRPTYCDRGHWKALADTLPGSKVELDAQDGWPRYYMDRDRAIAELTDWIEDREARVA
jgi:hypothetical protein